MSEFINNSKVRVKNLLLFSQGILRNEDGSKLIEKFRETLENVTPHDMLAMEEKQLQMGIKPGAIKDKIEKVMNTIYDQLKMYEWIKPQKGHALYYLMLENRELEKILNAIKKDLKNNNYKNAKANIIRLFEIEKHYQRKENILFPFLEKNWQNCMPLTVMWSLHDDIRMKLKITKEKMLQSSEFNSEVYKLIGELFFLMYGMISKEELVIYPVAMETLNSIDWQKIQAQSSDLGYSFISVSANLKTGSKDVQTTVNMARAVFQTISGGLNRHQLALVLNTIPLDLTFIDENDEVKYFSNPKDRFFPRSPAIIGRKVQKCHPPESVHIVEKILNSFKAGIKDEASFHIQMRGKFILIRYYALRDESGKYQGTLEVGQDITEIRKLNGEKRLLDWQ